MLYTQNLAEAESVAAVRAYKRRVGLLPSIESMGSSGDFEAQQAGIVAGAGAAARESLGLQRELDPEIVDMVLRLGYPGINTAADVDVAVKLSGRGKHQWNDVGVAYELLAERKRSMHRAAQIEDALRSADPPAAPPPATFAGAAAALGPEFQRQQAAAIAAQQQSLNARRRRW